MERLFAIMNGPDPAWSEEIQEFIMAHPEFQKYLPLIPLTRFPMGFGKNPGESSRVTDPRKDMPFEHLIYYVCGAGVNATYASKQWDMMVMFLRENQYDIGKMLVALEGKLQPAKVQVYRDIFEWLKKEGIKPEDLKLAHVTDPKFKIKGVGPGAIVHLNKFFGNTNVVDYTDRGFIGGFTKVYGLTSKPTASQILAKVESWGHLKGVGNAMCFQVFHYASKLGL